VGGRERARGWGQGQMGGCESREQTSDGLERREDASRVGGG